MKKMLLISLVIGLTSTIAMAQEQDSLPKPWKWSFDGAINGTQAQYSNWAAGGVNSVSVAGSSVLQGAYKKDAFGYSTSLNLKYGAAWLDDDGLGRRKTDDLIHFKNKVTYDIGMSPFAYFGGLDFLTQFDEGFEQDTILSSSFLAPLYIFESAGIQYKPVDFFSTQAGLALKQTFVNRQSLVTRYGVKPGDQWRNEAGITSSVSFEKVILPNVKLTSALETFTNLQNSYKDTDITFNNELTGAINSYLSANLQVAFLYDTDTSKQVQAKQVLSVGVSFKFF